MNSCIYRNIMVNKAGDFPVSDPVVAEMEDAAVAKCFMFVELTADNARRTAMFAGSNPACRMSEVAQGQSTKKMNHVRDSYSNHPTT